MNKKEFLKMHPLDQLKFSIEESLEDHKRFSSDYWKGSEFMGVSILLTIEKLKKINKL